MQVRVGSSSDGDHDNYMKVFRRTSSRKLSDAKFIFFNSKSDPSIEKAEKEAAKAAMELRGGTARRVIQMSVFKKCSKMEGDYPVIGQWVDSGNEGEDASGD